MSLEKKDLSPHPLGNCLLLDPLPFGISDTLHGGRGGGGINNILVWTVSIFS